MPTSQPERPTPTPGVKETKTAEPIPAETVAKMFWEGEVPPQKWMNFYTRVLSRFQIGPDLRLRVKVEVEPQEGIPKHKIEETKRALKELGLSNDIKTEEKE